MKKPPYDTGKVKIGILYVPPVKYFPDEDATIIQASLLKDINISWSNVSNAIKMHLKLAVVYLWVFALVAMFVKW